MGRGGGGGRGRGNSPAARPPGGGITAEDKPGSRRSKQIAYARQLAIYLIYDILGLPLAEIGTYLGGRDHTTIGYARDKIDKMRRDDPIVERQIQDIRAKLGKA